MIHVNAKTKEIAEMRKNPNFMIVKTPIYWRIYNKIRAISPIATC